MDKKKKQYLEVEVINRGESAQAVITNSKEGICCFSGQVNSKQEAVMINPLRQAVKNMWYQQNMPIFNRAHLMIQIHKPIS